MQQEHRPDVRESFTRGIEHFNRGEFFQAHEELEDAWRASSEKHRLFLQGMTQAAVALHHRSTGNRAGATSVLARALRNIGSYPAEFAGIDLERLRNELRDAHARLLEGNESNATPQIRFVRLPATLPPESEW